MTQQSVMFVANQRASCLFGTRTIRGAETYPKRWRGRRVAFELFFEFYKDVDQFTGFFTEFSPNLELTLDFLFSRVSRNHIIFNNDGTFDLKGGI